MTREKELRGYAIVVVNDPAKHRPFLHQAFTLVRQSDDRRLLTNSLMRSTGVVEVDVFGHYRAQMRLFAKRAFTPLTMMILSRHSERTDRIHLSAWEFEYRADYS